jgi:putative spermidine/putrescine transport system permease protein
MNVPALGSIKRGAWFDSIAGIFGRFFVALVFAFLAGPFIVIFLASFSSSQALVFPPPGFSLQWYQRFIDHILEVGDIKPGLLDVALTSAGIGLGTVAVTLTVGVFAAYVLARSRWRGRELLRQVFVLPVVFPQIVIGVSLLVLFSELQLFSPAERLILGHATITLPYVVLIVGANLEASDPALEEAALGLGAGHTMTFLLITLPLVRSGLVAAAVFAFVISFTNFTISFFLVAEGLKTLPLWVFEVIEHFLDPVLAVVSVFLIAMTAVAAFVVDRLVGIGRLTRG